MSDRKRQMHLGVFVLGTGNHSAGWRMEGAADSSCSLPVMQTIARIAERGKFDLFFISDGLAMDPGDHPSFVNRFEPITLLSALSMVTTHVGLGATVSTSFSEPYPCRARLRLARSSERRPRRLERRHQHPRQGRAQLQQDASSPSTTCATRSPANSSTWCAGCGTPGTTAPSSPTRRPASTSTSRRCGRSITRGGSIQVKGPLNIERSPQGHPVIIQAGGSAPGQELSARSADLVFSVVNGDKASAKAAYDSLKQRVAKHGRAPDELPILPGVMPIIGDTDEQAKEQLDRLQSWLTPTNALALVSQRIGHDISGYPLDGPVPDFPEKTERGQAFSTALLDMARREKMTLRDLYNVTAAARGHWVIYGTPKRIADIFEEWFTGGLADGFVIMPAYFPGAFDDFVDQVVPELQRRGLYRNEYAGTTLRSHLGLDRREIIRQQAAS